MSKRVYISADYDEYDGDYEVVKLLQKWGIDNKHQVSFIDMAQVVSGSISLNPDCRICDLKKEFNSQINASSAVVFVVGKKTKNRVAGTLCERMNKDWYFCTCTPYKQNSNGSRKCKCFTMINSVYNVGEINNFSYLQHEFEQAKFKGKDILVVYNSTRKESSWLPNYMLDYIDDAQPFLGL